MAGKRSGRIKLNKAAIAGIGLGFVLVVLLGDALAQRLADQRIRQIAAENRIPLTFATAYKGDPNQNAATYVEALKAFDAKIKSRPSHQGQWDQAKMGAYVTDLAPAYDIAEKLADCPIYQRDIDARVGTESFLGDAALKEAVDLFVVRAHVRAQGGDLQGAIHDYKQADKVANFEADQPNLMSGLVNIALIAPICGSLVRVAPLFKSSPKDMADLQSIPDLIKPLDYGQIMASEAGYFAHGELNPASAAKAEPEPDDAIPDPKPDFMTRFFYRPIWAPRVAQAFADDVADLRKDPHNALSPTLEMHHLQAVESSAGPYALFIPVFSSIGQSFKVRVAYLEMTSLALAAIGSGSLPVVAGTRDPYTTVPYKVIPLDGGWKLYSVGHDGVDNGGMASNPNPKDTHCDLVITYAGGEARFEGR